MSDLIKSIPDGWKIGKEGSKKSRRLSSGELVNLLFDVLGEKLKWNNLTLEPEFDNGLLGNNIQDYFHIFLNQKGWIIGKVDAQDALICAAKQNSYNPVWEWLLKIEKAPNIYQVNIDSIATDFLGTKDPLYDKMLKAFLIGAVSRAAERGCKFDNMLVLKGPQGIFKSSFFKALLPNPNWFCDTSEQNRKDLFMHLQTCFIYEHAELETLTTKKAVGEVKALLSSSVDTFRPPYGRNVIKAGRPSVMVGTVNEDCFLSDTTGSRRFWVIPLPQTEDQKIEIQKVKEDRESIWKAAILAWRAGENPYLTNKDQKESNNKNKLFVQENIFHEPLRAWTDRHSHEKFFTTDEAIIESGIKERSYIRIGDHKIAASALKNLGYIQSERRINGIKARWWSKTITNKKMSHVS